jgi:hypothetical protein
MQLLQNLIKPDGVRKKHKNITGTEWCDLTLTLASGVPYDMVADSLPRRKQEEVRLFDYTVSIALLPFPNQIPLSASLLLSTSGGSL